MRNTLASAILSLSSACVGVSTAVAGPQPYVKQQATCDGFPRLSIGMAPGYCAGLVFSPADDAFRTRLIKTPRMLLQLDDKRWLLTDLGAWTDKRGKVWLIEVASPGTVHIKEALGGLSLPHTIGFGPDGKIYVAEMNRIFRFNPEAGSTTTVVDGLPGNRLHIGRHPLSHFVFDGNGDFLINVGADTDQCTDNQGVPLGATCPESEGAVVREHIMVGPIATIGISRRPPGWVRPRWIVGPQPTKSRWRFCRRTRRPLGPSTMAGRCFPRCREGCS